MIDLLSSLLVKNQPVVFYGRLFTKYINFCVVRKKILFQIPLQPKNYNSIKPGTLIACNVAINI